MKLIHIKLTDPKGFRSLQPGFEYHFRSGWNLEEEQGFAPFVCAGRNGSGKSNLLELLAAIFYHMECIYLTNKPDSFVYNEETNPKGFLGAVSKPDAFELTYRFNRIDKKFYPPATAGVAQAGRTFAGSTEFRDRIRPFEIHISKKLEKHPVVTQTNLETSEQKELVDGQEIREFLPEYVLGYSSGENEILSLPFFKMRFIQFDEYWQGLRDQSGYPGYPESRMAYLDSEFSQAIMLCNLLFQDENSLAPFREDVKIEQLKEFRIILRGFVDVGEDKINEYTARAPYGVGDKDQYATHPAIFVEEKHGFNQINWLQLIDSDDSSADNFNPIVTRLKLCATCWYKDEDTDTLYLDYSVNEETQRAFRNNFSNDPLELFQAFRVLLTLNLYSVSSSLKADLYQSSSHYMGETVPTLASDERIMRFKFVKFSKTDLAEPVMLKDLSDGEHQLLHSLGLCLLFKGTQSLFLLDEPETHFNPDWRANFISRLHECFKGEQNNHEMLITTHTPFLISDSGQSTGVQQERWRGFCYPSRLQYHGRVHQQDHHVHLRQTRDHRRLCSVYA
ncbi:restriction system-associated AAA family ATPase [Salidesulfovibrio onnuriiensis]|uniref:restriction system-associated AAA family ATPase n=1 Tax=Salidesulfovibrio onnuriiensis TaxID=2583823 RepID=UPI001C9CE25C|nr:restriction system-associated AAA family ATPase [Salidesulfovibrio onnuriiensis]